MNELKQMMMNYFWGNDSYRKSTLDRKVASQIIQAAINAGYISIVELSDEEEYQITEKGKHFIYG